LAGQTLGRKNDSQLYPSRLSHPYTPSTQRTNFTPQQNWEQDDSQQKPLAQPAQTHDVFGK